MWNDFKKFAIKGNVIDLAVGVVIGTAFGKIVSSLVDDVIMPLVGFLIGGINFTNLTFTFGEVQLKYGSFIQSIVDFLIISFSIFLFIRLIERFKTKEKEDKQEEMDKKEILLTEIRDLLKNNQ